MKEIIRMMMSKQMIRILLSILFVLFLISVFVLIFAKHNLNQAIFTNGLRSISNGGVIRLADDSYASICWIPKSQNSTLSKITLLLKQAKLYNGKIPSSHTSSDVVFNAYIGPSTLYINTSDKHKITIQPVFYILSDRTRCRIDYLSGVLKFIDDKQIIYIQSSQLYDWLKNNKWKLEFKIEH